VHRHADRHERDARDVLRAGDLAEHKRANDRGE
jgi:hypothetical protein